MSLGERGQSVEHYYYTRRVRINNERVAAAVTRALEEVETKPVLMTCETAKRQQNG